MPCVYSVPGMDKVQARRDIVYKTVEGPDRKIDLKLDLYTPSGAKTTDRFPAVILISGGGAGDHDFRDAGIYLSYGRILGASGYVAITFAKRFGRDGDLLQGRVSLVIIGSAVQQPVVLVGSGIEHHRVADVDVRTGGKLRVDFPGRGCHAHDLVRVG